MSASEPVWLGTPLSEGDADVSDAYVTKIGGQAILLRTAGADAKGGCPAAFHCPKCHTTQNVSLLAQLYAPLGCDDRVLYVLTCAACGTLPAPHKEGSALSTAPPMTPTANPSPTRLGGARAKTSFCFAVRCENFSRQYYDELLAEHTRRVAEAATTRVQASPRASAAGGAVLFKEGTDWGAVGADDWGSEPDDKDDTDGAQAATEKDTARNATSADAPVSPPPELREAFPLAPRGVAAALKGRTYTGGIPLDLFVEPRRPAERLGSTEEQLAEAQRRYGMEAASLDTTSYEEDDESQAEKAVRKYVERIDLVPSQCVRWNPGGDPLRTAPMPSLQSIPACPACRAPRRFECQLTAPLVYYLTKEIGESKNADLHFANVFVYTCSKNCCSETAYVPEHVVAEDEL